MGIVEDTLPSIKSLSRSLPDLEVLPVVGFSLGYLLIQVKPTKIVRGRQCPEQASKAIVASQTRARPVAVTDGNLLKRCDWEKQHLHRQQRSTGLQGPGPTGGGSGAGVSFRNAAAIDHLIGRIMLPAHVPDKASGATHVVSPGGSGMAARYGLHVLSHVLSIDGSGLCYWSIRKSVPTTLPQLLSCAMAKDRFKFSKPPPTPLTAHILPTLPCQEEILLIFVHMPSGPDRSETLDTREREEVGDGML